MARGIEGRRSIERGLNSSVEYHGREYHVQTQCSLRGAPVIESLVFQGGEALVRITASYEEVARRLGFTGEDGSHLLEHQHAELIRKIRHGMLRDDGPAAPPPAARRAAAAPRVAGAGRAVAEPAKTAEPSERELLRSLCAAIDDALAAGPHAGIWEPAEPRASAAPGSKLRERLRKPAACVGEDRAATTPAADGDAPNRHAPARSELREHTPEQVGEAPRAAPATDPRAPTRQASPGPAPARSPWVREPSRQPAAGVGESRPAPPATERRPWTRSARSEPSQTEREHEPAADVSRDLAAILQTQRHVAKPLAPTRSPWRYRVVIRLRLPFRSRTSRPPTP